MNLNLTKWRDPQWRKATLRYWLQDPFWGGLDYLTHYALRYAPISFNAKAGAVLGELAGTYRFKAENGRIQRNLAVLRPDLSESGRRRLATSVWRNIGQAMTEYSLLDKLFAKNRVVLENGDYLKPFIENRQPAIFVFAHTGNWEICGNYVINYGFDVMGLYKPVRNRFSRHIADISRARMGGVINLIDANDSRAMRLICKHLANKGALWIAIDEHKNGQVHGPRFGRPLQTQDSNAAFAVRLAQRYQAAIIPVLNRRNEGSQFTVTIGQPFTVAKDDAAADAALLKLDQLLEEWVMANLDQWYMLHSLRL
ncbi:MAG: lysophospholipid acyltransferase family protein [Methylococcaceae bacterium]